MLERRPNAPVKQLLIDAWGCEVDLMDQDLALAVIRAGATAVRAREMQSLAVEFVPHGLTLVLVLAESHIVMSTWPEFDLLLIDILFCGQECEPEAAWLAMSELLRPRHAAVRVVTRPIGPFIPDDEAPSNE